MKKVLLPSLGDWIVRVTLAFIFFTAGFNHLVNVGPAQFAAGAKVAVFWGWCAALSELGSAAGILAGGLMKNKLGELLTRLSAVMIVFIMVMGFDLIKLRSFNRGFNAGLVNSYDVIAISAIGLCYVFWPDHSIRSSNVKEEAEYRSLTSVRATQGRTRSH